MFPAQTSLIPATVALVRFIEANGFGNNYPYWYLGTTPVKYLIGPVVPGLLIGIHKILPQFSLFDLSYGIILTSYFLFALGWGLLSYKLFGNKNIGYLVGFLSLFLPWHTISALAFGEVSAVLGGALTPWVLLGFSVQGLVTRGEKKLISKLYTLIPIFLFALLLLTNTTASIPAIIGLVILGMISDKHWEQGIKKAAVVIVLGWVLTLWWYAPNYWVTIFGAPSIGGKSAFGAFIALLNSLRSLLPVVLAIILVYWKVKPKTIYEKFTLSWLVVFGSMTLLRFMADPDFWMDWTSWMGEVEVGLALVMATMVDRSVHHFKKRSTEINLDSDSLNSVSLRPSLANNFNLNSKLHFSARSVMFLKWLTSRRSSIFLTLFSIYLIVGWFFAFQNRSFWLPKASIEGTVEYKIAKWLGEEIRTGPVSSFPPTSARSRGNSNLDVESFGELRAVGSPSTAATRSDDVPTVFLSGSTAFWLNSLVDVAQVRGGRDEASVDDMWRQAVWEIREGKDVEASLGWLWRLNVKYLVVHTENSGEFYHDFKYPEKFEGIRSLVKVYDEGGDRVYLVKNDN